MPSQANKIKDWDKLYSSGNYKRYWEYAHPSQELVTLIACGIIPKKGTVLDVGCGSGNEAIFLAQCGFNTIGLDVSNKALIIAKGRAHRKHVKIKWELESILNNSLEESTIDFINDRGCFHHISDEDRILYSWQVRRILKKNGSILIRGCKKDTSYFIGINDSKIDNIFPRIYFKRNTILPISLISNGGVLDSNIVLIRKVK